MLRAAFTFIVTAIVLLVAFGLAGATVGPWELLLVFVIAVALAVLVARRRKPV